MKPEQTDEDPSVSESQWHPDVDLIEELEGESMTDAVLQAAVLLRGYQWATAAEQAPSAERRRVARAVGELIQAVDDAS